MLPQELIELAFAFLLLQFTSVCLYSYEWYRLLDLALFVAGFAYFLDVGYPFAHIKHPLQS